MIIQIYGKPLCALLRRMSITKHNTAEILGDRTANVSKITDAIQNTVGTYLDSKTRHLSDNKNSGIATSLSDDNFWKSLKQHFLE